MDKRDTNVVPADLVPKHLPLEREEEKEVVRRWKEEGCLASRNRLVRSVDILALSVAQRFAHNFPHLLSDLFQEGRMGVFRAVEKYDHRRANRPRFFSYAKWWIRGYIENYIERDVRMLPHNVRSLDAELDFEEGRTLYDKIADTTISDVRLQALDPADLRVVHRALAPLSSKERTVIFLHYFDVEEMSRREIGKKFGVTRQTIQHYELQALRKIEKNLRESMPPEELILFAA
jgi:RNA polymerase sigma factor (sigma-70 family)